MKKVNANSDTMLLFASYAIGKAVETAKRPLTIQLISTPNAAFSSIS